MTLRYQTASYVESGRFSLSELIENVQIREWGELE